jgi:ABC-type multidrug transport system fused ATPase/permease subunit
MGQNLKSQQDPAATYRLKELLGDLWRLLRPYRKRFALATLARLVADLAWLYPAFAFGLIVDFLVAYRPGTSLNQFWVVMALFLVSLFTRYVGHFYAKRTVYATGERMALDAQAQTIEHLFHLDMSWHERENAGNKLKKIQKGARGIDDIMRVWIQNIVEIAVNFIGITIIVSHTDLRIGAILLAFIALYFPLSLALLSKGSEIAREVNIKEEEVHGLFFEALNNIRSVKVMGMAAELSRRVRAMLADMFESISQRIQKFQSRSMILGIIAYAFRAAGWIAIAYGIVRGRYEVGFLIMFNYYFGNMRESVEELSNISEKIVLNKNALARMMAILKEPLSIDEEEGKIPFPADWKVLKLDRVSFAYGDNLVLKSISFQVRRGEKIGIVGLSGAGKSTLFKLLFKERENYEGGITYDNLPLPEISKLDYFKYVAAVLQDTEVFNFSLRDNIVIANMGFAKDKQKLKKAMEIAHVSEFLSKLPNGIDTLIGEKGVKLSGGEKQRVGIARAIFKSPQIFFLDEATSHLDLESEEKIRDSLANFFKDVTAIVIAHRLTTIREMDRILVLENGEIIEQGSWSALMRKRGRFRELWDKQKL